MIRCTICGGDSFVHHKVLCGRLIADWQLSAQETAYVDDQQGCCCTGCGANLRVIALGGAIAAALGAREPLQAFVVAHGGAQTRILDINGAHNLSTTLSALPGYRRADYPQVDLHALPYDVGSFDIVLHSDTLEHVARPLRALEECRRILAPGGRLCFTVPTIVGRMTRSREGLEKSYHGDPALDLPDHVVHWEFGADVWRFVMEAGFTHLTLNQIAFPAAFALSAWEEPAAGAERTAT